MLLTCFLGQCDWGDAPRAPSLLQDWWRCSAQHYSLGLAAMLLSTPRIGAGGNAPLDTSSFEQWETKNRVYAYMGSGGDNE
jgi:hypothetical protein